LHLAPDRYPRQYLATQFLQAGCPSCSPTNSVKALKARWTNSGTMSKNHGLATTDTYKMSHKYSTRVHFSNYSGFHQTHRTAVYETDVYLETQVWLILQHTWITGDTRLALMSRKNPNAHAAWAGMSVNNFRRYVFFTAVIIQHNLPFNLIVFANNYICYSHQ